MILLGMENTTNPLNISEETRAEYAAIGNHIKAFERFVETRSVLMLGGFLDAVLRNDLMGAMNRADKWNAIYLHLICRFLYNHGGMVVKTYNEVK